MDARALIPAMTLGLRSRWRLLWTAAWAVLLTSAIATAQQDAQEVTVASGLSGSTRVDQGGAIAIYRIGLRDNLPPTRVNDLGHSGFITNAGIQIILSDLSVSTGLAAADFTELRLYRSNDAIWDGADVLLATNPVVNIGAATELDVTGLALGGNRRIAAPPGQTFFLIVGVISPAAVTGHAFTVGALANHVGVFESGFPAAAGNYLRGSAIVASDGNNVVIGAEEPIILGGGRTIPFGGEGPLLVLLVTSGLFLLRRRLG